jgi:cell division protein FtsN
MHFIDLKPNINNNEIYRINTLLNSIVKFEAPHSKREIPQCMRCQKYGHTKNYCRNTPPCVKCAEHHLSSACPRKLQDGNVTCVKCNELHPANYRGCVVHKQLQQNLYPKLRERNIPTPAPTATPHTTTARSIQNEITYSQVLQGQPSTPPPLPTHTPQPGHDFTELKQMMKSLMDQIGMLINLISALVTKPH